MGDPRARVGINDPAGLHIHDPLNLVGDWFAGAPERRRFDPAGLTPLSGDDRRALSELGLDAAATKDDIKGAYKALVKQYHPDASGEAPGSVEKFRRISDAYRHLATAWRKA